MRRALVLLCACLTLSASDIVDAWWQASPPDADLQAAVIAALAAEGNEADLALRQRLDDCLRLRDADELLDRFERALDLLLAVRAHEQAAAPLADRQFGNHLLRRLRLGREELPDPRQPLDAAQGDERQRLLRRNELLRGWAGDQPSAAALHQLALAFVALDMLDSPQEMLDRHALALLERSADPRAGGLPHRYPVELLAHGRPLRDAVAHLALAAAEGRLQLPPADGQPSPALRRAQLLRDMLLGDITTDTIASLRTAHGAAWRFTGGIDLALLMTRRPQHPLLLATLRDAFLADDEAQLHELPGLAAWQLDAHPAAWPQVVDEQVIASANAGGPARRWLGTLAMTTSRPAELTRLLASRELTDEQLAQQLANGWRRLLGERELRAATIEAWKEAPWCDEADSFSTLPCPTLASGSVMGEALSSLDQRPDEWLMGLSDDGRFGATLTRLLIGGADAGPNLALLLDRHGEALAAWSDARLANLARLLQQRNLLDATIAQLPAGELGGRLQRTLAEAGTRRFDAFMAAGSSEELVDQPQQLRPLAQTLVEELMRFDADVVAHLPALARKYRDLRGDDEQQASRELSHILTRGTPREADAADLLALERAVCDPTVEPVMLGQHFSWRIGSVLQRMRNPHLRHGDRVERLRGWLRELIAVIPADEPLAVLYLAGRRVLDARWQGDLLAAMEGLDADHALLRCWRAAAAEEARNAATGPGSEHETWLLAFLGDDRLHPRLRMQAVDLLDDDTPLTPAVALTTLDLHVAQLEEGWQPQHRDQVNDLGRILAADPAQGDAERWDALRSRLLAAILALPATQGRRLFAADDDGLRSLLQLLTIACAQADDLALNELLSTYGEALGGQTASLRTLLLAERPQSAAALLQDHAERCWRDLREDDGRLPAAQTVERFLAACGDGDLGHLARLLWAWECGATPAVWQRLGNAVVAHDWQRAELRQQALAVLGRSLISNPAWVAAAATATEGLPSMSFLQTPQDDEQRRSWRLRLSHALLAQIEGEGKALAKLLGVETPERLDHQRRRRLNRLAADLAVDRISLVAADQAGRRQWATAGAALLPWFCHPRYGSNALFDTALLCDALTGGRELVPWYDNLEENHRRRLRLNGSFLYDSLEAIYGTPAVDERAPLLERVFAHPVVQATHSDRFVPLAELSRRGLVQPEELTTLGRRLALSWARKQEALAQLAVALGRAERHQEALAIWQEAAGERGNHRYPTHWRLAWAKSLLALGRETEAITMLETIKQHRIPADQRDWVRSLQQVAEQRAKQEEQAVLDAF